MKIPKRAASDANWEPSSTQSISRLEAREIADAVVQARKRAGKTQAEIAKAMGITQSAVARLESSATLPRLSTLQRFARATSSRLHLSIDPVSNHDHRNASHTMTDTLSRPEILTDRRSFLAGAVGVAGLLGLGPVKYVSAQEATAAVEGIDDYVWTPPDWEDPTLFEILERGDDTVRVRTPDGEFDVPINPQRIVCLDFEYTTLVPLGITEGYVGVLAPNSTTSSNVEPSGLYSQEIEAALADVPTVGTWTEIDIEQVLTVEPDLVLGFGFDWGNRDETWQVISEIAPFIRSVLSSNNYPQASLQQFGELLGRDEQAEALRAEHEDLIARGREAIAPFVEGTKSAVLILGSADSVIASPSYFTYPDGLSEGRRVLNTNSSAAHFRELGLTPSSYVEILADEDDRTSQYYNISMEQIGLLDADYIFLNGDDELTESFRNHPVTQSTAAYKADQIISNVTSARAYGLGARQQEIRSIVTAITGEPFE